MRIQLPILSFLSLPLLLLPLPWHFRARNIPTLTIFTALFFLSLIHGINSIVWSGSVVTKWVIWCDITTKFTVGVQVALPAAGLCITKHLESVASIRQTMQTAADKRRRKIFEFCLCGVLPCITMALHYVVQGHRFDIAEDFGCLATVYYSWPALLIIYIPPLVLAFVSLIYATTAFVWFMKRRAQFAEHLRSNNSGLTTGRYMRLMALAVTEIVMGTGLGSYVLGVTIEDSFFRPYDSWAHVHVGFSRIAQFPRALVPEFFWDRLLITWYIPPMGSVAYFVFFGFGQEAVVEYRRVLDWFRVHVFRRPLKPSNGSVLPTFSAPARTPRVNRDDIDMDMISIDEKWDQPKKDDVETSRSSVSSLPSLPQIDRSSSPVDAPSRPLSTPPAGAVVPQPSPSTPTERLSFDRPLGLDRTT